MSGHKVKVTTDTNNHNSCMTTHILPYNFNICYGIYLKLTDVSGIGMQDANIMYQTFDKFQQELLTLLLFYHCFVWENCSKVSKSSIT